MGRQESQGHALEPSPHLRRKRYGAYDSRGRIAEKRPISERPQEVETRATLGHWEIDTVQGSSDTHCILTVVERKTGYVLLGKLPNKPKQATEQRAVQLMRRHRQKMHTSTSDHGTEFHSYRSQRRAQVYCFTLRLPTILGSEAVMNMPME